MTRQYEHAIKKRQNGICVRCGKERSLFSTWFCDDHLVKVREYARIQSHSIGRHMGAKSYFINNEPWETLS